MKKPLLCFILILSIASPALAQQKITPADLKSLHKKEDSLRQFVRTLIMDTLPGKRMRADSSMIKTLRRSLAIKNSFYFPFDSLQGVGKVYSPDSMFRIITWSIAFDEYYTRQRGVIQYRTPDGSPRYIPLYDQSEFTDFPMDSVRTNTNWIGAIYYNIILKKYNGRNYYTLFGFDQSSIRSNKKWIEVLTFDSRNMPVFGGNAYFNFDSDSIRKSPLNRYSIEYKREASAVVNYEPDLGVILVDHLVSESDEPELAYTLVPDGDYEGFKWENGKWVHIDKVFTQKLEDGQAPVPDALRDAKGNLDMEKNRQQTEKNKARKKVGGNN